MINLHERMLPTSAGVEPVTSWSPVGRRIQLSHRGRHFSKIVRTFVLYRICQFYFYFYYFLFIIIIICNLAAILDAILDFSKCPRMTGCHQPDFRNMSTQFVCILNSGLPKISINSAGLPVPVLRIQCSPLQTQYQSSVYSTVPYRPSASPTWNPQSTTDS